jgi:hypothetical protein
MNDQVCRGCDMQGDLCVCKSMTSTDALATALRAARNELEQGDMMDAAAIIAALPEGTALVTTDSLADALDAHDNEMEFHYPHYCDARCAAAIIQAAKEAERE